MICNQLDYFHYYLLCLISLIIIFQFHVYKITLVLILTYMSLYVSICFHLPIFLFNFNLLNVWEKMVNDLGHYLEVKFGVIGYRMVPGLASDWRTN